MLYLFSTGQHILDMDMKKSKVVLLPCQSYDPAVVERVVRQGIELLGGVEQFAKANEKILLKPNLLGARAPEKCVTTHPAVFQAVAKIFRRVACALSYGDSPSLGSPLAVARKAGIAAAATELSIPMANFAEGKEIYFEKGFQNRRFKIAQGVLESDGLISISKLKTHGFQKFTGALKNQFGCVPGMLKGEFHVKLPDPGDFAKMLLDLNRLVAPRLYIMDGIRAMEGNGPSGGDPIAMNVLLFSTDPIALDATVCRMIDCDPEFVPTIRHGGALGIGFFREEEIDILGQPVKALVNRHFKIDRKSLAVYRPKGSMSFARNSLVPRPRIVENKCVKCGQCIQICPVQGKALDWQKGNHSVPPGYDYSKCIRCYCCQEICPEGAIELFVPLARRIINKF